MVGAIRRDEDKCAGLRNAGDGDAMVVTISSQCVCPQIKMSLTRSTKTD